MNHTHNHEFTEGMRVQPSQSWEIRVSGRAICSGPVLTFGTAMSQVMKTAHLLLLAILVLTKAGAQAWLPAADVQHDSTGTVPHDLGSPVFSSAGEAHGADGVYMHDVEPFEVLGATVHGPVSSCIQQDLLQQIGAVTDPRSRRALLHGPKQLKKYPECNKCRLIRCGRDSCNGHCKKQTKLNFCSAANVASSPARLSLTECSNRDSDADYSVPFTVDDFTGLPASDMATYDTAIVTVPAPYIGCADIGNRPSGCPAPGTGAMRGGRRGIVGLSRCNSELYVPDCPGPLMPFGVCECAYEFRSNRPFQGSRPRSASRLEFRPCRTPELAAGSGVGGGDGSESDEGLVVMPAGAITQTWFSNFTSDGDLPNHTHTVTAATILGDVNATLTYYRAIVVQADSASPEVDISEDYELTYDNYYTILIPPTPPTER
eukprot:jgi/Ulvmu1/3485/UM161_0002.1